VKVHAPTCHIGLLCSIRVSHVQFNAGGMVKSQLVPGGLEDCDKSSEVLEEDVKHLRSRTKRGKSYKFAYSSTHDSARLSSSITTSAPKSASQTPSPPASSSHSPQSHHPPNAHTPHQSPPSQTPDPRPLTSHTSSSSPPSKT
jgi:hypothetical protein